MARIRDKKAFITKRKIQYKLSPDKLRLLKATGFYDNNWGDLKFVLGERHGKFLILFYDSKVKM